MKLLVKNYDTKELISKLSVKADDLKEAIAEIILLQKTQDVIGLGHPATALKKGFGLGISSYCSKNGIYSSQNIAKNDRNAEVYEPNVVKLGTSNADEYVPAEVEIYGENNEIIKTGLRLEFYMYPEGLILNTGKMGSSIFGSEYKTYFEKVSTKRFFSTGVDKAKKFDTPKKLLKYIQSKEDIFKYMVEKYAYNFSVEYASSEYAKDLQELPKKKHTQFFDELHELQEYLNTINNSEKTENERPVILNPNSDEMKAEAIARMKELGLMAEIINSFEKDKKIMMSEGAGILYNLDETANKAVSGLLENNDEDISYLPYHVIHTMTNIGELYDVLYVSSDGSNWDYERFSYHNQEIEAYVYNASEPLFSENGPISIKPCNGGLKREF